MPVVVTPQPASTNAVTTAGTEYLTACFMDSHPSSSRPFRHDCPQLFGNHDETVSDIRESALAKAQRSGARSQRIHATPSARSFIARRPSIRHPKSYNRPSIAAQPSTECWSYAAVPKMRSATVAKRHPPVVRQVQTPPRSTPAPTVEIPIATMRPVPAVVLRGPANTAPESIFGPFASLTEAEDWARAHPRESGYCVAEELTSPNEIDKGQSD